MDSRTAAVNFRLKVIASFTPQEDVGIILEWLNDGKTKAIDCGEIRDLEIFTGELPISTLAEVDVKKGAKKEVKGKKKDENVLQAGHVYSGFFEAVEDDVRIDEVDWRVMIDLL